MPAKKTKKADKKILFVASEAAPFLTTGGLGEVIGALPKSLCNAGKSLDVRVVLPLYEQITQKFKDSLEFLKKIYVDLAWRHQYCGIFAAKSENVTYYFIDNEYYFKRQGSYGYFDDGERYAFFCRAILDMLKVIDFIPDIIHAHDWQAALVPIYLATSCMGKPEFKNIKTVFTIHNMQYQGIYSMDILEDVFDISYAHKHILEFDGMINLMKGAMICANIISTVSPTYAKEIRDPEYARGLESVTNMQAGKLRGILNGIDTHSYDPKNDPTIFCGYDSSHLENKLENKLGLQSLLGLQKNENVPLIAMITRLVDQKGMDLVLTSMDELAKLPLQLVVLGNGDRWYESCFKNFCGYFPDRISVNLSFDHELSKKIYAGADMFLMPSKFEPCGLGQMMAARYGAVPIVRATGGLKDSIVPYDREADLGNGFSFESYSREAMMEALKAALTAYENKDEWQRLVGRAMDSDFGWEKSALEYIEMYKDMNG